MTEIRSKTGETFRGFGHSASRDPDSFRISTFEVRICRLLGRMTVPAIAAVIAVCAAASAGADEGRPVVSASKPPAATRPAVPLPPLAVVLEEDPGGTTWRETGEISGSLEVARKNFQRSLAQEGWALRKAIPLSAGAGRSSLFIWQRKGRELLVMLWQKEPGKCGFSWGIP